ncbi:MAG: adenosylcobinamide-phosphate synthase CbiB [Pseudomonadota bacterium]
MILDALMGEPRWLWSRVPHPAVLMGRAIGWADRTFNSGATRRAKGVVFAIALTIAAYAIGHATALLGPVAEVAVGAVLIAQKSLVQHVVAVADGLRQSTASGRAAVAMIVGRDTSDMTDSAVARAAIESAAENHSDGVVAPIFWFAVLGLPGLVAYKAINTADSMIGYRTPRHEEFGMASARLDDLVNWIPARLTAILILLVHGALRHWPEVRAEAPLHRSPNAGWPESAMARVHGIALSGPRAYDGQMQDFPFVNPSGQKDLGPRDIAAVTGTLWRVWALTLGSIALLSLGAWLIPDVPLIG